MSKHLSQTARAHNWIVAQLADGQTHRAGEIWNAAAAAGIPKRAHLNAGAELRRQGKLIVTSDEGHDFCYRLFAD